MEQFCRTCLQTNVEYLHLFNHFENGKALSEMLTDCVSLKLEQDDGFPFWMCLECKGKLVYAWAFRTLARESDSILRGIYNETTPAETVQAKTDTLSGISDHFYNYDKDASKEIPDSVIVIERNLPEEVKEENVEVGCSNSSLWDSNCIADSTSAETEQNSSTVIEDNSTDHCTEENSTSNLKEDENMEVLQDIATLRLPKISTPSTVRCDECKKFYSYDYYHSVHILTHEGKGRHVCMSCNQHFNSHYQLDKHMAIHKNQQHVCEFCGDIFASVFKKRIHRRLHKGQYHSCRICNKTFRRKRMLDEHLERHEKETQYICEICGKMCQTIHTLKSHMNSHATEKNFVCELCNKRYKTAALLRSHKESHSNLTTFTCEKCGTTVKRASSFRRHMLAHNNGKMHPCKICGKLFKDPSTIKRHMLTHTGETPYICSKCPYKCRYKQQFDNHSKKHKK